MLYILVNHGKVIGVLDQSKEPEPEELKEGTDYTVDYLPEQEKQFLCKLDQEVTSPDAGMLLPEMGGDIVPNPEKELWKAIMQWLEIANKTNERLAQVRRELAEIGNREQAKPEILGVKLY